MHRLENRQSRSASRLSATVLAVVMCTFILFLSAPATAEDKPGQEELTFKHSYDEVLEASQMAFKGKGWVITSTDKDKGMIVGNTGGGRCNPQFEVRIASVSPKPETRVTVTVTTQGRLCGEVRNDTPIEVLAEIQRILATYPVTASATPAGSGDKDKVTSTEPDKDTGKNKDKKNKNTEEFTKIYPSPYDQAFQRTQDWLVERGWLIASAEKEQGLITGKPASSACQFTFSMKLEKFELLGHETKLTLTLTHGTGFACVELRKRVGAMVLDDLQKSL